MRRRLVITPRLAKWRMPHPAAALLPAVFEGATAACFFGLRDGFGRVDEVAKLADGHFRSINVEAANRLHVGLGMCC